MKTTYDRLVFALHDVGMLCKHVVHMRQQVADGTALNMHGVRHYQEFPLPLEIPKRVFEFGYWFAGVAEEHWSLLDLGRKDLFVGAVGECSSDDESGDAVPPAKRRRSDQDADVVYGVRERMAAFP